MIQRYEHTQPGYKPLVLTRDWQAAQLNFSREQMPACLSLLDRHDFTDETFLLIRGRCILIAYEEDTRQSEILPMQWGITYNIPQMMWHNIAMDEGSVVLITEGRDAHIKGQDHLTMPGDVKEKVLACANSEWL